MNDSVRLSSARADGRLGLGESIVALSPFRVVSPNHEALEARHALDNEDPMLEQLDRHDRLRLVEFVCSFAWADLEIRPEERVFISRLIRRLDLGEEDDLQVQRWLELPPRIDDLDPTSIPPDHRRLFVEAIEGLIAADGEISDEERDSFEVFKQLLDD